MTNPNSCETLGDPQLRDLSGPLLTPHAAHRVAASCAATVLDVRWQLGEPSLRAEFEAEHIPGAAWVEFEEALTGSPGESGRHPLPDPDEFAEHMRAAGVHNDAPVIIYDANNSLAAARAWWLLTYFGHPRVFVIDGGLAAWKAAGLATKAGESGDGAVNPGDFRVSPRTRRAIDADEAAGYADSPTRKLLDARLPERFRGEHEPVDPVAGHIPGAINVPTLNLVDAEGRFLEPDDLQLKLTAAGVGPGDDVATYCGSGVQAMHLALALEVAGHRPAAVYVGSWSHWITDADRPTARG